MTRSFSIVFTVLFGLTTLGLVCADIRTNRVNQTSIQQAYVDGVKASIGQPIKYGDLPAGHYKVVSIIPGQGSGLAVVERKFDPTMRLPEVEGFFLVQDMPTLMLVVDSEFSNEWTNQ